MRSAVQRLEGGRGADLPAPRVVPALRAGVAVLAVAIVFVFAAATDVLAVQYHAAREARAAGRAAVVAMLLEAAAWLPIAVALETGDWRVAVAAVAGSGVGTWRAVARLNRVQTNRATLDG